MTTRVWGAAIAAVLLLAGCTPQATDATTSTPTAPVESPSPTPVEPEFTAMDPSLFFVNGIEAPWGVWDTADVNFAAPGNNIGCGILGAEHEFLWGCAITEKTWEFPTAAPEDYCYDAQVPCGGGIEADGTELPHPRYRGDPGFPGTFATYGSPVPIRVLDYGQSVTFGDVTCYSAEIGITCEHAVSGHGFVIAADRNDIY
jgi:hypothetical protein